MKSSIKKFRTTKKNLNGKSLMKMAKIKRSSETQQIASTYDTASGLSNGQQIDPIILDFAKSFDKMPHQSLLKKLKYYSVYENTIKLVKSFLVNQKTRTSWDNIRQTSICFRKVTGNNHGIFRMSLLINGYIDMIDIPIPGIRTSSHMFLII